MGNFTAVCGCTEPCDPPNAPTKLTTRPEPENVIRLVSPRSGKESPVKRCASDFRAVDSAPGLEPEALTHCLENVPLFRRFPKDQLELLAANVRPQKYEAGQIVITQGEEGDQFYIIDKGEAEVLVQAEGSRQRVATLTAGDYFGEKALITNAPRNATVQAKTSLKTLAITRGKFRHLGLDRKCKFPKRKAVVATHEHVSQRHRTLQAAPVRHVEKTKNEKTFIMEALNSNDRLRTLGALVEDRVSQLADCAWKMDVAASTALIEQGDVNADHLYVVDAGSFTISVAGDDGCPTFVSTVKRGASFGELGLLYSVPRAATVRANTESVVWVIDRYHFKKTIMAKSDYIIDRYVHYLDKVDALLPLLGQEKRDIANALTEITYERDETIMTQGEVGNVFYFLIEGEVEVSRDATVLDVLKADAELDTCVYFGEQALLHNERCNHSVKVVSDTARMLFMDADCFSELLVPFGVMKTMSLKSREKDPEDDAPFCPVEPSDSEALMGHRDSTTQRGVIKRAHLKKLALLGCGGFGAVWLCEHRRSRDTFALKALSKGYVVKSSMQDFVNSEKEILANCNSHFIVKLFETYNDATHLYFLMEPVMGGELFTTYSTHGFCGSERHARFYAAGVTCAFVHLHARCIIYRDLKPENLLLSERGYLKVTDMGLAKICSGKTFTTCGTPDYFAPEVVQSSGHTIAVDWWTLGILIFELLCGRTPFESKTPMLTHQKIVKGIGAVGMPKVCNGAAGDYIKELLRKCPSSRLPMKAGGTKNIKRHPWYDGFDWTTFQKRTMVAPYVPTVKNKRDASNFITDEEDLPPVVKYVDPGTGWDNDFATST